METLTRPPLEHPDEPQRHDQLIELAPPSSVIAQPRIIAHGELYNVQGQERSVFVRTFLDEDNQPLHSEAVASYVNATPNRMPDVELIDSNYDAYQKTRVWRARFVPPAGEKIL